MSTTSVKSVHFADEEEGGGEESKSEKEQQTTDIADDAGAEQGAETGSSPVSVLEVEDWDGNKKGEKKPASKEEKNLDLLTRVDPPGHEVFTAWISRENSVGADGVEIRNIQQVRKYMGPAKLDLQHQIRMRRAARAEDQMDGQGLTYNTVSYKKGDSPVWHNKALMVNLEHHRHKGLLARVRSCLSCYRAKMMNRNPIRLWLAQTRFTRRILLASIGFIMSVVGFGVSQSADKLLEQKLNFVLMPGQFNTSDGAPTALGFVIFFLFNLLFAFLAFLPTAFRPMSAGSGIAEAKAVLNGILLPQVTELFTAACKFVSVIFSATASLPVGLEGPMIFMGLSVGDNSQRVVNKESFPTLQWDGSRRDLATVGTACGVTAAFFAPVGGVLFALEEGASHWSASLTFRCFAADCVTAIFSFIWLYTMDGGGDFNINHFSKFTGLHGQLFDNMRHPSFSVLDYFAFMIMGAVAGIIGAIWCETNRGLAILRSRLKMNRFWKLVEVLVLTFVMSTLIWWLPKAYKVCSSKDGRPLNEGVFRQYGCPEGEYNHLATLLLNPTNISINLLFWEGATTFTAGACLIAGTVYLLMLLVLFGTSISMGIFIPLLYIGACYGRAIGLCQLWWDVKEVPTYAIVGSVAMLAGPTRVLISITVIMVETTGLTNFVTPFMLVTLFARVFGKACFHRGGIYDIILQLKGIPFLEGHAPSPIVYQGLKAQDIMSGPGLLLTLDPAPKVRDILETLKKNSYLCDIVVVDPTRGGSLVGTISRKKILILLEHKVLFDDSNGINPSTRSLRYKYLLNAYKKSAHVEAIEHTFTEEDKDKVLDLTPYVEIAHPTFDRNGSAERAYEMFRTMGLRTLIITGKSGIPVGFIARTDLYLLEELGEDESRLEKDRSVIGKFNFIN